jgi:protease I
METTVTTSQGGIAMKVACVLAADFSEPYHALLQAGHEVTVVGLERGATLEGKKGKAQAAVEKAFAEVPPDQFDALFIPGGSSPDKLRAHDEAVQFVKAMMRLGKPAMVICHGPQLLLTADEYKGHKMTAWKTVQGDLKKAGANVVDQEVVVDGNLVTSRQPSDIPAFIRESLKVLDKIPSPR